MKKISAVFLDRDGTINEEVGYLDSLAKLKIIPAASAAIRLINQSGMKAVVISNQSGVARGIFPEEFVQTVNNQLEELLKKEGTVIDKFYYCPHHPTAGEGTYRQKCSCRKPEPGMLRQAARELNLDLTSSYLIGDRYIDIETAGRVGAKGVLVKTGFGAALLRDEGPDKATPENKPAFIAGDIMEAVQWILKNRKQSK